MHKAAPAASLPGPPSDNSYIDLAAGSRLRITVPLRNSGGYQVSYYSIEDRSRGKVRLTFTSAEITRNGSTVEEPSAPPLPFELPQPAEHIRLIYLVRKSSADHQMAIAAAKNLDTLNAFTDRLKRSPEVCQRAGAVFCEWVPAGVAVRPEYE